MCIIVVKPKGVKLPPQHILESCFSKNNDGCGYMYRLRSGECNSGNTGKVRINKGFMDFKSFWKSLMGVNISIDEPLVMHFRIATSGGISPEMTHPFPLTQNEKILRSTKSTCEGGMAHNGVISHGYVNVSDTMKFVCNYMSDPLIYRNLSKNKDVLKLIQEVMNSSRIAVLTRDELYLLGSEWYKSNDGTYYSGHFSINNKDEIMYHNKTNVCREWEWENI